MSQPEAALKRLDRALTEQRVLLRPWEQPSAPTVFETVRCLDDLNMREVVDPKGHRAAGDHRLRFIQGWGANHALKRIIPDEALPEPFRLFASTEDTRRLADEFLLQCGVLELGERLHGWFREGLVEGSVRHHSDPRIPAIGDVLTLKSVASSHGDDQIGMKNLRWASDRIMKRDRGLEIELGQRTRELSSELERHVGLIGGWGLAYTTTSEIDEHFRDCARLYVRRIFGQDMLGPDDVIGGQSYSDWIEVLVVLSARAQRHAAFAAIAKARDPRLHLRNLLTTHSPRDGFIHGVAHMLDADIAETAELLRSFTLGPETKTVHLNASDPAWAPIIDIGADQLILPVYGLDINPFLFLLADLKARHEKDWFSAVNVRERRWVDELEALFEGRKWRTNDRNLRLKVDGRDLTDIDFAVQDEHSGDIALFQLKWQRPVGMDNRVRRNVGSSFVADANRWVDDVTKWLDAEGDEALRNRLGFTKPSGRIVLFVLGRYHAFISGHDGRNPRAAWSDWAGFQRLRRTRPRDSLPQLATGLRRGAAKSRRSTQPQSFMFPISDLSVVLNPSSEPEPGGC